jgi:hypothetical protein
MKKIFTLLFSTAMLSTAFAQYSKNDQRNRSTESDVYVSNDNRGNNKHDHGYKNGYYFTSRERDMQIAQINRVYEYRIQAVKNRYFMNWRQKKHMIMNLEAQRDNEIHEVMKKYNDRRNQFGDRYRRDRNNRW